MVPSFDLAETGDFLARAFQFELVMDSPFYAVLSRDGFDLHLCRLGEGIGEMSFYLEVDDLESAWQRFCSMGRDDIRVREPFIQDYGMKEFHLDLPETRALMFVGERLKSNDG